MPDEIIIPGGVDDWWPSHRFDDFRVGAEHTVFEWCMIYTDRHPAWLSNHNSATAKDRENRLTLLGANWSNVPGWRPHPTLDPKFGDDPKKAPKIWDDERVFRTCNAVYQQLAGGITSGRLDAKRVYLDDRPGELDPTLCVLDAAPVLAIARRCKDHGQFITRLLAVSDNATAPPGTERIAEATATDTDSIERLAEWIFAQRGAGTNTFDKLYTAARSAPKIGGFAKAELQAAFRRVYETKRHRPRATGWPLRSPYRERWQNEHC